MNPSGSEFTLRVAICDLVERLKRMQHKCTYLEECRNQLVKEVIRLRLQNEWLARQMNDSPEISSLPQNIQCFCNQPNNLVNNTTTTTLHTAHCHLNGQELNNSSNDSNGSNGSKDTKHSNKDESIHLINILNELDREELENRQDSIRKLTIQMLKDLDNEIKTGQLKSDLINFVKNNLNSSANGDDNKLIKFDDQDSNQAKNQDDRTMQTINISNDYEAFNNNSDYYTNSHNLNVPLEDLQYSQNVAAAKVKNEQETLLIRDNNPNKCSSNSIANKSTSTYLTKITNIQNKKDSNNKGNNSSSTLFNSIDLISQENQLISIINQIKNDLKYLHQGVLSSTDKLNKIKTRQLRHFFQKQINLDHSTSNSTTIIKHQPS